MAIIILSLLTAIGISGIAAYFSIVGLVAIFSAAPIPIAVMGSVLEVAKLVTASWLYRNWGNSPKVIKYYLTSAVVILSLITSMGIFGYLSKAHIEQTTISGTNNVQLEILLQQEQVVRTRIDFLLKQNDKANFVSNRINKDLQTAQSELKGILEKKTPLLKEKNKFDAELGPLKYITEFLYGEANEDLLNKAVRWVIITLIFVFDPLAILLLIAANISLHQRRPKVPVTEEEKINLFEDTIKNSREEWSEELRLRLKEDKNKVKIDKSKIHEIPPEILQKVFKK